MTEQVLTLTVAEEIIEPLTTLLQSGMAVSIPANISLGAMLSSLPGFDIDYITNRIETIFLDGQAVDDLQTPLINDSHVVALSAAMPGLAGAIFRKNSICAALRSTKKNIEATVTESDRLSITVKLFNMIAHEKGPSLLFRGCLFSGTKLINFFSLRKELLTQISQCVLGSTEIPTSILLSQLDAEKEYAVVIQTVN